MIDAHVSPAPKHRPNYETWRIDWLRFHFKIRLHERHLISSTYYQHVYVLQIKNYAPRTNTCGFSAISNMT